MFTSSVNGACKHFVENVAMHPSAKRLYEAAEILGKVTSQGDVARWAGVSAQALTNWENRPTGVSQKGRLDLLTKHSVRPDWIEHGEGEMLVKHYELIAEPGGIDLPKGAFAANQNTVKKVWVVGKGQGGMAERIWTDGGYPVGITDEYAEINSSDPHAFLVRVEGSSMYPKFEEGNFALVEPGTEPELEDCVLVRLKSGQTMIKRLLSRRSGYKLGSYNDPVIHEFSRDEVTWCYYIAHEVPRRRIKSRH